MIVFLQVAPALMDLTQYNELELAFIAADFFHVLIEGASADWIRDVLVGQFLCDELLAMIDIERNSPVS